MSRSADVERRALELLEQWLETPDEAAFQALLASETEAVRARLVTLRGAMTRATGILPTELPDDPGDEVWSEPPERVGAFRLVRRIGIGGMGGVWLGARDDGLYEQEVAVKFIRAGLVNLAGSAFRAERQILAKLEHPNIARLIDGGATGEGVPYLVMEYVDGAPIDEAVQGLPMAQKVRLFVKAADAVQFAHSRLVVHADLKPSNIFVDGQGRVKLLDFGISRMIEGEGEVAAGALPMTRAYASPERIAGAAPSIADDVFALGCILAGLVGDEDADLAAIAAKARAGQESERYGSAAALIADLDRWRDRLPVAARAPTLRYRAGKFVQRHRAGVLATSAALLLLAGLAGLATRSAVMASAANAEAQARFVDARGAARLVSDELLMQLASRPGTFAVRNRTVQAAQIYLDRLAASKGATADVRLEAAQGLQRVAEAQGKPGMPNLALTEPAYRNLGKALDLLDGLPGEEARLLMIRVLLDRARLSSFARNDIEGALGDLKRAEALLGPAGGKPDFLRAQYFIELSVAQQWNDEYPASIVSAREALAYMPADDDRDHVVAHSTALDLLAEAIYYSQDGKLAIPPYREALALLVDYARTHATDQVVERRIARAQWALGSTLSDFGNPGEAAALLDDGEARSRAIMGADPQDEDARRMVRIVVNAHGQAVAATGLVDEGIAIVRANIDERKAYLDQRPDDPMRMRDYMVAVKGLGDMQLIHGRTAGACQSYQQAQGLIDIIEKRGQLTKLDLMSAAKQVKELRAEKCAVRTERS